MEPQENIYEYEEDKRKKDPKKKNCFGIVTVILLVAFVFVVGLIIGALVAIPIILSLPAVIVLAIVIGLMLVLSLILTFCDRRKEKEYRCKCRFYRE